MQTVNVLKNIYCIKKYLLAVVIIKQILVIPAGQQEMAGQDEPRAYHYKQCRMLVLSRDLDNVPDPRGKKTPQQKTTKKLFKELRTSTGNP